MRINPKIESELKEPLWLMKSCKKCGKKLPTEDNFCSYCGAKNDDEKYKELVL